MKLAIWLLNRFGVLERNESLAGDLLEERASGRSVLWLWRQTIAAIADSVAGELRGHWVLALRAIATGWALNLGWGRVVWAMDRHGMGLTLVGAGYLLELFGLFTFVVWPALIGWIVARTHHRSVAMVLAWAGCTAAWTIWHLIANYTALHHSPFANQWIVDLELNAWFVLSTLVGGILTRPRQRIA